MDSSTSYKPKLFLSYNHNDTVFADMIAQQIRLKTNDGIQISRYTSDVKYKDSFKQFMDNIEEHDFVLCIVSDDYLRSKACMYEVGEVIKDHNYSKKLLFVVLSEKDYTLLRRGENANKSIPDIYNVHNRVKYAQYWQNEYEKLYKEIKELGEEEAKEHLLKDLKIVGDIYRNDISEFLVFLADSKGTCFSDLHHRGFADIINWIIPGWDLRLFSDCKDYDALLRKSIEEVSKTTRTDYNQIALKAATGSHQSGLVVFADNVGGRKQRYRTVAVNGLMYKVASTGRSINAKDVRTEDGYFNAVYETRSELIVPIKINGNTIGIINSEAEAVNHYSGNMIERVETIADCLAIALIRLGYSPTVQSKVIPYVHI